MMDAPEPYFVDIEVPDRVLLGDDDPAVVTRHPNSCEAVWYSAEPSSLSRNSDGSIQEWRAQEGLGARAIPAKPNTNHLRLADDGGLQFQREINAGMVICDALIDPTDFSLAIRYHSDNGEARSLFTVNPNDSDTYLFLSEKDGQISWQDQNNLATLSMPAPVGGGWILAGFANGVMSLSCANEGEDFNKAVFVETAKDELARLMEGSSDVFLGCRSHRKGIVKTLGESRVYDVLLWIDRDMCRGDQKTLNAARRYCELAEAVQ